MKTLAMMGALAAVLAFGAVNSQAQCGWGGYYYRPYSSGCYPYYYGGYYPYYYGGYYPTYYRGYYSRPYYGFSFGWGGGRHHHRHCR